MDVNSRLHNTIILLLIIHAVIVPVIHARDDNTSALNLDCTNDFDELMLISCQLDLQSCTEHTLTLKRTFSEAGICSLKQCGMGWCCCSTQIKRIIGDYQVTVLDRGRQLGSKIFGVAESVKPNKPSNILVNEANGNFEITWENNMSGIVENSLRSVLTYYKKGDTVKNNILVNRTSVKGLRYYKLSGQHLQPSTTYVVSVRSISDWSGKMSDTSNVCEFKTSPSSDTLLRVVIICLSIAAVTISGAIYFCCAKFKEKWWDSMMRYPAPKLWISHQSMPVVLKSVPPMISSVCVDPLNSNESNQWSKVSLLDISSGNGQQSSGISTVSSHLSYSSTDADNVLACVHRALAKAFPNIKPISSLAPNLRTEFNVQKSNHCGRKAVGGTSFFDNKTYTFCLPQISPQPHRVVDPSEVKAQTEMLCDVVYRLNESDLPGCCPQQGSSFTLPALQDLISSSVILSPVIIDTSYQPCTNSSERFTNNSSNFICPNTTITSKPGCQTSVNQTQNNKEATACSQNPTYDCTTIGSQSFSAFDVSEPFHSISKHNDVHYLENNVECKEHVKRHQDTSPRVSQNLSSFLSVRNHQDTEKIPVFPFLACEQPQSLITDDDYHKV